MPLQIGPPIQAPRTTRGASLGLNSPVPYRADKSAELTAWVSETRKQRPMCRPIHYPPPWRYKCEGRGKGATTERQLAFSLTRALVAPYPVRRTTLDEDGISTRTGLLGSSPVPLPPSPVVPVDGHFRKGKD